MPWPLPFAADSEQRMVPAAMSKSLNMVRLARDRGPLRGSIRTAMVDNVRRGAVARRHGATTVQRAEPGPRGPLVIEAAAQGALLESTVWGPSDTPTEAVDAAMIDLRAWLGQDDDPTVLTDVVANSDPLRRALRELGEIRLGSMPRVFEALGRSVIFQLVQGPEAVRSISQVAARFGEAAVDLSTWPSAAVLGAIPAFALRQCGVSLRGAQAIHAASTMAARLEANRSDMELLHALLTRLPGVADWTSAETRRALGDPDAVSVGDYHVHKVVTYALAGVDPRDSTDGLMLELLEPFAGQRGRVITLIARAGYRGLLPRAPRRGAHAALSAHRYW